MVRKTKSQILDKQSRRHLRYELGAPRETWATWRSLGARASDGQHVGLQGGVRSPPSAGGEEGRPELGWVGLQSFKFM